MRLDSRTPVAVAGQAAPPTTRPAAVTTAFFALVAAVGFGIAETAVHAVGRLDGSTAGFGSLAVGLLVRAGVYLMVLGVAWRMLRGDRWARPALAVGIGVIGAASLLIEPISAIVAAGSLTDPLVGITAAEVLGDLARAGHICAVLVAIPAMYTPAARAWFRTRGR